MKYTEDDLVRIAKRDNNKKRPYLIVDPCQGKHIPVQPSKALELFKYLGSVVNSRLADDDICTIISFAETATAIGCGVLRGIEHKTYYIQTTREELENAEYMYFSESHSHATEQKLVKNGLDTAVCASSAIIFVEDEVTTGNTILGLINQLEENTDASDKKIIIASILNGMDCEAEKKFESDGIELVYLLKTNNVLAEKKLDEFLYDGKMFRKSMNLSIKHKRILADGRIDARRICSGRKLLCKYDEFAERVSNRLEINKNEKILVLGTEEFMYPAMLTAEKIEKKNNADVYFHATTRSPILTSSEENYPLHNRFELESLYDNKRRTFVYDLEKYDKVYIMTDSQNTESEGLYTLLSALEKSGNSDVTAVFWRD
ncbi:MAG: phosphoribosyltransferase family protein [Clostridia bacterium]|jgi:orotate phosphoribosyltransferase|nr:phosphoribosyltransferase family protein [Clostridia bacterium]MCI1999711.1 phosphoribosyltransferase family protein [Clostridia bacterium]MCI2013910.1 phosphoribosyltransferase family protein [Clostridia bacterium]